jgi:hypothetical protein
LLIGFNIATAVVIYPLVKRLSATLALGYVTARIMETVFIAIGVISIISVLGVNDALAGAGGNEATALVAQGNSLVDTYDWAFLFGPGLVVGFGNGLILGYLMYRSGLVPRPMAMLGLIGGPLLILSFVLILFDVRQRARTCGPDGAAGGRLGGIARHLLRVEGVPAEPTRRARGGVGIAEPAAVPPGLTTAAIIRGGRGRRS